MYLKISPAAPPDCSPPTHVNRYPLGAPVTRNVLRASSGPEPGGAAAAVWYDYRRPAMLSRSFYPNPSCSPVPTCPVARGACCFSLLCAKPGGRVEDFYAFFFFSCQLFVSFFCVTLGLFWGWECFSGRTS